MAQHRMRAPGGREKVARTDALAALLEANGWKRVAAASSPKPTRKRAARKTTSKRAKPAPAPSGDTPDA